jgi:predicted phosphoadenosine phosphosulfate sulfurtransferase
MDQRVRSYVQLWENRCYKQGIPDQAPERLELFGLVPSYRRIVVAILKNDITLKSLGYTPRKSLHYNELKRIELACRGETIQLKLF